MDRSKGLLFWEQKEAVLHSMYLKHNSDYLERNEKAELLSYLPDLKGKRILDLASGIGRFTRHFASTGESLVSVEVISKFVQKNRLDHSDCTNVEYICKDAMDLQLKENSLDFVFINWLFLYLEDEEATQLLNRIHSWLRVGGEVFLRESCELVRSKSKKDGYYAHYRTPAFYEDLLGKGFICLREGYIKSFVDCFSDPFQCFWLCRKEKGPYR